MFRLGELIHQIHETIGGIALPAAIAAAGSTGRMGATAVAGRSCAGAAHRSLGGWWWRAVGVGIVGGAGKLAAIWAYAVGNASRSRAGGFPWGREKNTAAAAVVAPSMATVAAHTAPRSMVGSYEFKLVRSQQARKCVHRERRLEIGEPVIMT